MTSRIDVRPARDRRAAVRFLSFQRAGKGIDLDIEIELHVSYMGKNNGNSDLVCEKNTHTHG